MKSPLSRQAPRLLRLEDWILAAGSVVVVASLSRPLWSGSSWTDASAGVAVAVSGAALAGGALKLRSLTLGLITALVLLLAFWAKWLLNSEPLTYLRPVPFDNDAAIRVTAAFAVPFALMWLAGSRMSRMRQRGRGLSELSSPTALWTLLTLGFALVALRVAAAKIWTIGVPGRVPTGLDVPALKSVVFHASAYGPLVCATLILVARRSMTTRVLGGALLAVYASAGAALGNRGAVVTAAIVAAFVFLRQPAPGRRRSGWLAVALWSGAAVTLLAAMAISLTMRSEGSDSSSLRGTLMFISRRVGGLDYLSVAVSGVDRLGTSWTYLSSANWASFLTHDVYGYPPEAVTGTASTLPGLAYGVASWGTVLAAGIIFGLLAGFADGALAVDHRAPTVVVHLGMVIAWLNLLLEGTSRAAALIGLFFAACAALLAFPIAVRSYRRGTNGDHAGHGELEQTATPGAGL